MLYDTIYNFFLDNVFGSTLLNGYSSSIMGVSTSLASWLSHTCTLILLALGVLWLILVVRWIFRVCAGLLKW